MNWQPISCLVCCHASVVCGNVQNGCRTSWPYQRMRQGGSVSCGREQHVPLSRRCASPVPPWSCARHGTHEAPCMYMCARVSFTWMESVESVESRTTLNIPLVQCMAPQGTGPSGLGGGAGGWRCWRRRGRGRDAIAGQAVRCLDHWAQTTTSRSRRGLPRTLRPRLLLWLLLLGQQLCSSRRPPA